MDGDYRRYNYLSRLIDLMKKSYLKENGTTLWIDAHIILRWDSERLSRVKKLVYITMRLGLATTIRFNIWRDDEDYGSYQMVPQDLFT